MVRGGLLAAGTPSKSVVRRRQQSLFLDRSLILRRQAFAATFWRLASQAAIVIEDKFDPRQQHRVASGRTLNALLLLQASREAATAVRWVGKDDPGAARRLRQALVDAAKLLRSRPLAGRLGPGPVGPNYRLWSVASSVLRPACRPSGKQIVRWLRRPITVIHGHRPWVEIILRADSHYCTPKVLRFCRSGGVDSPLGVAPISTLRKHVFSLEESTAARAATATDCEKLRRFEEFRDAATSWDRAERIIARCWSGGAPHH